VRPFFCQIEAIETAIWLTEVARREKRYARFWAHIQGANEQANPELTRVALKMATGTGKTTVMAMLIAWQTLNAVRQPGPAALFSRGFLIVSRPAHHPRIGCAFSSRAIPTITSANALIP